MLATITEHDLTMTVLVLAALVLLAVLVGKLRP